MFIVFEWVDWCGKDTQINKVFEYLREKNKNIQIWLTKEPTANTTSWKMILQKLKSWGFSSSKEALELYVKDREEQSEIRREILKHSTILSSRFDYTTYAYQTTDWVTFEDVKNAHNYENILIPDITFLFDITPENIEARLKKRWWDKEFFENIEFLTNARNKYLEVMERFKNERKIYIIDANKSIDEVFLQLKEILNLYY